MMLSRAYAYGLNTLKRFFSIEGIGSIISKMKSSHGWFCLRWCEWYHDSGCGLKSDSNKVESFSWSRDWKSRFVILFSSPIFRIHFRNLFDRKIEPSRGLLFYFRLRFFKYIFENFFLIYYFMPDLLKITRTQWKLFFDRGIESSRDLLFYFRPRFFEYIFENFFLIKRLTFIRISKTKVYYFIFVSD